MNKISKIVIITILFTILVFARTPHVLSQIVRSWPVGIDETGVKWMIYDLYNAKTHCLDQDTVASYTDYYSAFNALQWTAECGQLPDWDNGDTIIAFGSWDSVYAASPGTYGDNVNHTGFYWLFSDTLNWTVATQYWSPDDTLWVMPQPYAYQVGGPNGDIQIEITNPPETRRDDQTEYDVMGYWIWADTTGAGTPNAFNDAEKVMEVGFFSVVGDTGDITVCTHSVSNYHNNQTVYWAYKLVARPDTVNALGDTMGYSTHYFSQNSNSVVIIGIEENTNSKPGCVKFEISPNPFTDRTDITCSIGQSSKSTELRIYDISGKLVKDFLLPTAYSIVPTVSWDGTDESGELLPSGVYFIQAKGGDLNLTRKVILQR